MIYELQHTHGMSTPSEVILSGGSAGGLAVFYNLDHLATLLPATTRLTGFVSTITLGWSKAQPAWTD